MAVKRKNSMKERLMANFGNMTGGEPVEEIVDISEDEDERRMSALREAEEKQKSAMNQQEESDYADIHKTDVEGDISLKAETENESNYASDSDTKIPDTPISNVETLPSMNQGEHTETNATSEQNVGYQAGDGTAHRQEIANIAVSNSGIQSDSFQASSVSTGDTAVQTETVANGANGEPGEGRGDGALADLGPNHRLTTIIPEKMVTYLRIRAASEGVFKAQISYMLMKLIREDMENHKDLTNF